MEQTDNNICFVDKLMIHDRLNITSTQLRYGIYLPATCFKPDLVSRVSMLAVPALKLLRDSISLGGHIARRCDEDRKDLGLVHHRNRFYHLSADMFSMALFDHLDFS